MHAKIINNQVVEWPIINLRQRLPNVSMPADLTKNSDLPNTFFYIKSLPAPGYNPHTHKLVGYPPVLVHGEWVTGYTVVPLTEEELSQVLLKKSQEVRSTRNNKLKDSDWTQLKDTDPKISAQWSKYRQQLRDITTQPGFPLEVTWPNTP